MIRSLLAFVLVASTAAFAQEGSATQAIIGLNQRPATVPTVGDFTLKVDNRVTALSSITPVTPANAQVAILIDDGLRTSLGRELNNLQQFVNGLPAGVEVFVGYMQNGRVVPGTTPGFTADHAVAARGLRLPSGAPGISASPYFCISDFVKNWPAEAEGGSPSVVASQPGRKARFVLMITNGVDPYNGSTSPLNQDSPYVDAAVQDAQRAATPVYSIYFTDAGYGRHGSFSGQSYLAEIAQGTGGTSFYQGTGNPVSIAPYLRQFQDAVMESYVATFPVDSNKKQVSLKIASTLPKAKPRIPSVVRPGTVVLSGQ